MNEKTGWQRDEAARRYGKVADLMIPGRLEVLNLIAGLVAEFVPEGGSIIDLGSGSGDVTEAVLQKAPEISAVLVDFSDEMLRRAEARFRDNPRIEIIKQDLNQGLPEDFKPDTLDAVVSCFCFHHIERDKRLPLYAQIRSTLKRGGIFIYGDRFSEESARLNDWMFDKWMSWITVRAQEGVGVPRTFEHIKAHQLQIDRDLGDKPVSLWETERDLRAAGFSRVDCLCKNQVIGVMTAIK